MRRNMQSWMANLINKEKKQAMPILSFPCVSLLDITVEDLTQSAELQARGMKAVADRTPACASVSMMDLSVEAEAFGAQVQFQPGEVPTVIGALLANPQDAETLQVPPVGAGRTGQYVKAVQDACTLITDRPVFAGVIGPYSLAGRLMGVSDIMINCYEEPMAVHQTLQKATDFLTAYIKAFKEAGANGVVIAEPLAGLLSPQLAEEFSEPYVLKLSKSARTDDFLVIYHNCGNNTPLMMPSILRTDCDGYHFGDAINMLEVIDKVPKDCLVMGNISPSEQFINGTPQSIRKETLRALKACGPGHPNFIISSGCDIPPESPWANIDAFFEAIGEYYEAVV